MTTTDSHREDDGQRIVDPPTTAPRTVDLPTTGESFAAAGSRELPPAAALRDSPSAALLGDGAMVLERLQALSAGSELLECARRHPGTVELVGGAVRDILLGRMPRELDVVVESDASEFAEALARRLENAIGSAVAADGTEGHCEMTHHERFGTVLVRWGSSAVDIATRRSETYPSPGALPDVAKGTPEDDLARRDFTVNAIAVALTGEHAGELRMVRNALEDLSNRRLRVLHDESFLEDPTRILRLVRYAARLGFEVEPHTASLAAGAVAAGALSTVTPSRLGAEVRLAFAEVDPVAPLAELDRLGVFAAWEPGVSFDEHVARTALEILPEDGSKRLLLAGSLVLELCNRLDQEETEIAMRGFLHDLELPAREGDRAFGVAVSASFAIDHIDDAETTEDLLELVIGTPVESLALAAAVRDLEDGPRSYGRRLIDEWLTKRRHISLEVTGDDLVAAGVPEGPEVGVRLDESYKLLLEERIEPGRENELRAALEARV
jgi:tRNA nucleotidyltransferase (CCA-adding enzyme)